MTDSKPQPVECHGAGALLRRLAIAATLLFCFAQARAVDWDEARFADYGGEYAVDCVDGQSLLLRITRHALIIERGSRRVEGRQIDASVAYFGQASPPDFQLALLSQAPGRELTVLIFRDRGGRYALFEADRTTRAELGGQADANTRLRDCDAGRRTRDGAAAVEQERQDAQAARDAALASPLADARFRKAYRQALGARLNQRWLAEMNGPSPEVETVSLFGRRYTRYALCKPHDCHDHNMVLLYDPSAGKAYAAVFEEGEGLVLLNAPPAALGVELQRLWRREWRQGR